MIRSPFNIKTDEGGVTNHANHIGGAKVALAFANYIVCIRGDKGTGCKAINGNLGGNSLESRITEKLVFVGSQGSIPGT